jgi:type VI secretion system secreted protein Hcp
MAPPLFDGAGGAQGADMYLHVQTARAGKIKGESVSPSHVDDIVINGWHWGIQAHSAVGSTESTSRRSYKEFVIVKRTDCASTGLMNALVSNDKVKEALLTMRRTGGDHEAFFTVKLKSARVTRVEHEARDDGSLVEVVAFSFTEVDVEYRRQQASGIRGGAYTFSDQMPTV